MTAPARIAVVGTSWWVERMHLPALLSHPAAEVAAFCGRDAARASALADRVAAAGRPRPAVETRWEALVRRPGLDAAIVAVPDDLHRPVAEAALGAGLHVCCEKPLARAADDARALRDAAARRGRLTMTYFTYRWLPHYRFARALVRGGAGVAPRVGRVRQVQLSFVSAMGRGAGGGTFMPAPRDPWRQDPARSGGLLADLGTHAADLVRVVAGEVTRVAASARGDAVGALTGATNNAVVVALEGRGGGGAPWHGAVQLCAAAEVGDRGLLQSLVVVGDAATLALEVTVQGAAVRLHQGGRTETLAIPEAYGGHADPFAVFTRLPVGTRLFAEAVARARAGDADGARALTERAEWAGFDDGASAQEVVDAAARSAAGGRWEDVPGAR